MVDFYCLRSSHQLLRSKILEKWLMLEKWFTLLMPMSVFYKEIHVNLKSAMLFVTFSACSIANIMKSGPEKCPAALTLQEVSIQANHLIRTREPEDACCTPNGFPYHIKGLWNTQSFLGKYKTNDQW